MRFICEWCHEQVSIIEGQNAYREILAHFNGCPRRSPLTTQEQVDGLAAHITTIVRDREEKRMREAG